MKRKQTKVLGLVVVMVLLISCIAGLAACNPKDSTPDNSTLVIAYAPFNQKFSPFFSSTAYDQDVWTITQVNLLSNDRGGNVITKGIEGETVPYNGKNYTYYGLSDLTITQNADGTVDYRIQMRTGDKAIRFSDGQTVTVQDAIFTMYAYSDVDYDGSTTFYSMPVKGMKEWRTNLSTDVYTKYLNIANAVLDTFDSDKGEFVYAESTAYTKAQYDALVEAITAPTGAWKALASDIVSYVVSEYDSYAAAGTKYAGKNGINLKDDKQTIALGMSMWGFGAFTSEKVEDADGTIGKVGEDYKNLWTRTTDEEEAQFEDAEGNMYRRVASSEDANAWYISAQPGEGETAYGVTAYTGKRYIESGFTAIFKDSNGKTYDTAAGVWPTLSDYVDCLMAAYENNLYEAADVEKANGDFDAYVDTCVEPWIAAAGKSEMNGASVNSISGITYSEESGWINIKTTEYDATFIYQLLMPVAPMHYYGDASLWNPASGSYGFARGNLAKLREKTSAPMGAGPYKFVSYEDGIVTFEANADYWEGAPKTRFVKYKEYTADADKVPALIKGDVDIATPSINKATVDLIKETNNSSALAVDENLAIATDLIDYNGYGYIGIDANRVKVGTDKKSDASKNLRRAFATLFAAYREYTVTSYYEDRASVIEYPITNCSWAAPQPADEGYAIAFSKDADGKAIYTADMTAEQKWAAAKTAAIGFFKKAGYTWDGSKFTAAPAGASLAYEVGIGGDGTGDHPTYALLVKAQADLGSIGITLNITDFSESSELFNRLDAGELDIWVAAWGGAADPDMYQVYHSDNKTNSNHYHIADDALDAKIVSARKSADKNYRKATYKECLDIIIDWAVEIPVYQRKDCAVYRSASVKVSTITPDTTPYWNYLTEIYKVEVK